MPKLDKESKPKIEERTATPPVRKKKEEEMAKVENLVVSEAGQLYYEKGVTKNMGDYNSARVTVGVTLPFNPTETQVEAAKLTMRVACQLVDDEIEKQVEQLKL